ncbi:MAG TPA: ATP-binding protein [Actinomycetota bacterium]|nr:ATP-binding protein [Actinomycetota bacterium]
MITEDRPVATTVLGVAPTLEEIERQRKHLWVTAFIALVVVSLAVAVVSYWTQIFPEAIRRTVNFSAMRFVFVVLSVGFIAYAVERERRFRVLTRELLHQRERAIELYARLEQERNASERLEASDRMRADVVASVTHQLKTPLTSLLGYATILRKRADTLPLEQRDEFIGVIEEQGYRILGLIENLLQSTRVEAGLGRLQRIPVDLSGIVRTVSREMGTGRQRTIEVDVSPRELGLFGDPAAMEHIVTNLLDNALKYSEPDTVVRAAVFEGEGEVLLTVADEGMGIAADELPQVFDRFSQASNARGHSSVGLGLYIVHSLVIALGGRVWVDSELGKGTTFTVALPVRR